MTELREKLNNIVEEKNTKVTPENLRAGAEAFGVQGTFTADADATAEDIANGKTAYVNGEKIVGAMKSDAELIASFSSSIDSSLGSNTTRLPSDLTSIRKYAFYSCSNLALTELPVGITTISERAFSGCSKLALTKLPDKVTTIEASAFNGCSELPLTYLPETVTQIKNGAFSTCSKLALTKLPDGLQTLEEYAFDGCSKLAITEIPEAITILNSTLLRNCLSLTEITVKGNLTKIASWVFYGCTKLEKLVLPNVTAVATLGSNVFNSTPIKSGTGYIYVPDELVDSYKAASGWNAVANQIKGLSELS